jgi:hypothetical protein
LPSINLVNCVSFQGLFVYISFFSAYRTNAILNTTQATMIKSSRSWRIPLLVGLTLLLALPLWQLSNDESAATYKQYIYDNVSKYFVHEHAIYNNTLYQGHHVPVHAEYNFSNPCEGFPDTTGILLVMKTGASESFSKIPTHLLTSMQCLPDFLIFSDLVRQLSSVLVDFAKLDDACSNSY